MIDLPKDDLTVGDDEGLLRRVPHWPNMCKFDKNLNSYRPTSACFSDPETKDRELSITLEQPLLESGNSHEAAIKNWPEFGLARVIARFVREELDPKQVIKKDPTAEDPHHGLIVGDKNRKTRRDLAKNSTMIIQPKTK